MLNERLVIQRRDALKLCLTLRVEADRYRERSIDAEPEQSGYAQACRRQAVVLSTIESMVSRIFKEGEGSLHLTIRR